MSRPPDALVLMVCASLVAPPPPLGLSFAFDGPDDVGAALAGVDVAGVDALLFVALGAGLFGFAAWTTLVARHAAAAVTPFALLVPVFGITSAALLLGERPSALELGGAVLICAGLAATLPQPRAPSSGAMFWLTRNVLSGSYSALTRASRS